MTSLLLQAQPLVSNPIAIFLIVLGIILMAPILLARLKIPHIISMIVAGIIVGPYGFNILADDSSFTIFGQVGLLYLMFLAGIEIDMFHLRLNLRRGFIFGLLTFLIPMGLGTVTSIYLLHLDAITSLLLGAMYAAHTLIAYPVVARFGVARNQAVLISIVGTIIAVVGALLVLGAVLNVQRIGQVDLSEMGLLLLKVAAYCAAVLYIYPRLTRRFFRSFADPVSQYIFILAAVFLSALGAKAIGLEGVLGSFFAGLVLNRFVPQSSPLMTRIEFVGNAIFIPYFLIGVGMMINLRVVASIDTLTVAAIMLVVALVTKWLSAFAAQKIYKMDGNERRMMFGLTTAHTAVALAVVTIGYNTFGADGHRLMDETVLNGTILVILITCAIAPIVTTRAASAIKVKMLSAVDDGDGDSRAGQSESNRILIPIANPVTARPLVELALLMNPSGGSAADEMFALHVRNDNSGSSKAIARSSLDLARQTAAAANRDLQVIDRFDLNTVTGVLNSAQERDINEIFIGLHRRARVIDSFLGAKLEQMLKLSNKMIVISRLFAPANTLTRIVVVVPPKAQFESGFVRWVKAIGNLARELGCRVIFCGDKAAQGAIATVLSAAKLMIRAEYRLLDNLDDVVLLATRVKPDDLLVVVGARPNSVSYSPQLAEIPGFLQKHFSATNIVIIFPEQFGENVAVDTFANPLATDLAAPPVGWMGKLRARLRRRNRSGYLDI
ncbi:MAG: cation:proton antiporter [Muribaculaceae bacterium]|nr:cation:proton antiporter [Muribaculaceae bacterium]